MAEPRLNPLIPVREKAPLEIEGEAQTCSVAGDTERHVSSGKPDRSEWLQALMADPSVSKLLAKCPRLPAVPQIYTEVTAELSSPAGSLETVARLVSQDPVMTAKLLQVVNSAFFGLEHEVTDSAEAIMHLGTERTRSLILLASVFSRLDDARCASLGLGPIWNHSLRAAALARGITLTEIEDGQAAEAAFTAGLLHDIGKLIIAGNLPSMYVAVRRLQAGRKVSQRQAEQELLGTTHAQIGACLLGQWGLPLPILEAVAWHHVPQCSPDQGFSLLTAVHCADVFAMEIGAGSGGAGQDEALDWKYLLRVGLVCRPNAWRELCGLHAKFDEGPEEDRIRRRQEAKIN